MIDNISKTHIQEALKTACFGKVIHTFTTIDSTNNIAKSLASQGAEEGTLVIAEKQTRGQGRWGRRWDSPKNVGLWFSLILRPEIPVSRGFWLTLLGTTSLALALENQLGIRFQVRWPNDLIYHNKKIAGILVEVTQKKGRISHAILGMGVNMNQNETDFPNDIRDKATSLKLIMNKNMHRVTLLSHILLQLENDYRKSHSGMDFVLQRWVSRSSILGKNITCQIDSRLISGVVKGFSSHGDLILVNEQGEEKKIMAGDAIEVKNVTGC